MKKFFLKLTTILVVAIAGFGFTSCGNDVVVSPLVDPNINPVITPNAGVGTILGTWKCERYGGSRILTFLANGTGTWKEEEYIYKDVPVKSYSFSYTFNINDMTLTMVFPDGDVETKEVKALTATTLILDGAEYTRM